MLVASFFAPRHDMWGCDYDALLHLLDLSCYRLGLRHVVISDADRPGLETARFDLPENLMAATIEGQRQLLAATSGPVLFTGADCLLTRDPRPYLSGDMTITIGTFSDCPMNTGAVWCADGPRCAPVWADALARGPKNWGDDQTCLYAAVQDSGLDVTELRCEEHNAAPGDAMDRAGMPTVAHFRGRRKAFMADWAARFLGVTPRHG